jgi:hypothetical protein
MFDSRVHGLGALAGVNDPSLVYVLAYMHCKHSQNKPFSCLYIVQSMGSINMVFEHMHEGYRI